MVKKTLSELCRETYLRMPRQMRAETVVSNFFEHEALRANAEANVAFAGALSSSRQLPAIKRTGYVNLLDAYMSRPECRTFWEAVLLAKAGAPLEFYSSAHKRALLTGSGLGEAAGTPVPLGDTFLDLVDSLGSLYPHCDVVRSDKGKLVYPRLTAAATTVVLKPASQGSTITEDSATAGSGVSSESRTIAARSSISREVIEDSSGLAVRAQIASFVAGLGYRYDFLCASATGADNTSSGDMFGCFYNASVAVVTAAAGNVTISKLEREDLCACMESVRASAFEKNPAWIAYSGFLPVLSRLKDSGGHFLTPPTGPGDFWRLLGHRVLWTSAAPSTNSAGSRVMVFGDPRSILVRMARDLEIQFSDVPGFAQNVRQARLIQRGWCEVQDTSGLAVLQLPAA